MAKDSERSKVFEVIQTVAVLAAIPLGLIPLVQYIASDDHGDLFRALFGEQTGSMGLLLPGLVIVVALVIVGVAEVAKKRGNTSQ
ncbi:hypothetical protein ACF08M_22860 [Streptomyces sp. NPDC015032]|uniref:hypothetical protein n=1 Tax=Streptomyces sp. NPDC015032 TaxID=3364937 RepID=UPI0036F7D70D